VSDSERARVGGGRGGVVWRGATSPPPSSGVHRVGRGAVSERAGALNIKALRLGFLPLLGVWGLAPIKKVLLLDCLPLLP